MFATFKFDILAYSYSNSFYDGGGDLSFFSNFRSAPSRLAFVSNPAPSMSFSTSSFSEPTKNSGKPYMRFKENRMAAGLGTSNVYRSKDMRFACNKKK